MKASGRETIDLQRPPLLQQQENEEDVVLGLSLRPKALGDFIGQRAVVENLQIAIKAATARHEPL